MFPLAGILCCWLWHAIVSYYLYKLRTRVYVIYNNYFLWKTLRKSWSCVKYLSVHYLVRVLLGKIIDQTTKNFLDIFLQLYKKRVRRVCPLKFSQSMNYFLNFLVFFFANHQIEFNLFKVSQRRLWLLKFETKMTSKTLKDTEIS